MDANTMNPTDEQTAILDFVASRNDNLMINALAGTGKSTTLRMIEKASKIKPILYLVFNKKNAEDATKLMSSTTTVRTFNSLGHRIWAKSQKVSGIDGKKTQTIIRGMIDEVKDKGTRDVIWAVFFDIVNAVARAKALGYIPENHAYANRSLISRTKFLRSLEEIPDDLTADLIDATLLRSIQAAYAGNLDFNDQVYMPALFGGTFPRFPLVMVDEYQDLNPINHAMLKKLTTGRLIGVGDPWQSIYAFRGANSRGMSEAVQSYSMSELDLSVSFRCPSEIVKHVRWRVPKFKWLKEGGYAASHDVLDGSSIDDGATIVCRNNAPLFRCALRLLGAGRSVSLMGSDIGPRLVGIMKKLGPEDMTKAQTIDAINDWLGDKLERESTTAQDLADCMMVFAQAGGTLGGAIAYAEHVFKQKGSILHTTGHKAKGLEWDNVYHLSPSLLGADSQDLNLRYVISTRSANQLIEIEEANISW